MPLMPRRSSRRGIRKRVLTVREFMSEKLGPAFHSMKDLGIYARNRPITCCRTCLHAELQEELNGGEYVAYHEQNVPHNKEDWDKPFEEIYLQHSLAEERTDAVRNTFLKHGMVVDWKGEHDRTIVLRMPRPSYHMAWAKLRTFVRMRGIFWYWHTEAMKRVFEDPDFEETNGYRMRSKITYDERTETCSTGPGGPPGVTNNFNAVSFARCLEWHRPPPSRYQSEDWKLFDDDEGLFEDDPEGKLLFECAMNGQPLKKAGFTEPVVLSEDGETPEKLKGVKLDTIAFRGNVIRLRCASMLDGPLDTFRTYNAVAGNCFTIAELYKVFAEHMGWVFRCEAHQKKLSIDHCFFEGLFKVQYDPVVYEAHWGS